MNIFHAYARYFLFIVLDRVSAGQPLNTVAAQVAKEFDLSPATIKRKYRTLREELQISVSEL